MNGNPPQSYSIAVRKPLKGHYFRWGVALTVMAYICWGVSFWTGDHREALWACNASFVLFCLGQLLTRAPICWICTTCGNEVTGQPMVCRTCHRKCLPQEPAPSDWQSRGSGMATGLAVLGVVFLVGILLLQFFLSRSS